MTDRDEDNFDLTHAVQDALRHLHPTPPVPAELDERILFAARDAFARRMRTRLILRRTAAAGGAVAAAIALFFGVQALRESATRPSQMAIHAAGQVAGDVNGDGRVDIIDALALARRVESGDVAPRKGEDLDHDGKVTKADVEQVAQLAVKLPDSELSGGVKFQ